MGNFHSSAKSDNGLLSPQKVSSSIGGGAAAAAGGLDGVLDRRTPALLTVSPMTLTRSASDALSFRSDGLDGKEWNERQLLVFFDNVRQAFTDACASAERFKAIQGLEKDHILSFRMTADRRQLEVLLPALLKILEELIDEEQSGHKPVGSDFIVHTHIDKLLEELLQKVNIPEIAEELRNLAREADVLLGMWKSRLGISWTSIDSHRLKDMKLNGCHRNLRTILFPPDWNFREEVEWEVSNVAPGTRAEGCLGFQPGQWWLNMHCCMRDGVIKSPTEPVTKGRYGVTALAMTVGEEIDGRLPDDVIYIREGFKREMPFALLGNTQPIRVIRGSRLKSKYAPSVGVRYDGLYKVTTYSHKSFNDKEGIKYRYICKIGLRRLSDGQAPFETALSHPTPSERDQFFLYWTNVGMEMQERFGIEGFRTWSQLDADEVKFKEYQRKLGLKGPRG